MKTRHSKFPTSPFPSWNNVPMLALFKQPVVTWVMWWEPFVQTK